MKLKDKLSRGIRCQLVRKSLDFSRGAERVRLLFEFLGLPPLALNIEALKRNCDKNKKCHFLALEGLNVSGTDFGILKFSFLIGENGL